MKHYTFILLVLAVYLSAMYYVGKQRPRFTEPPVAAVDGPWPFPDEGPYPIWPIPINPRRPWPLPIPVPPINPK